MPNFQGLATPPRRAWRAGVLARRLYIFRAGGHEKLTSGRARHARPRRKAMLYRRESFNDLFREMGRWQDELGRMFGPAGRGDGQRNGAAAPPVNVWEDAENV